MEERLTTAIKGIRSDKRISTLDEKSTRAEVIDPVLERLGWDKFGEDFVIEYSVPGGAVDYALHVRNMPKVFIEAKNPREDLRRHVDQLVTYCAKHGVPLAALTNGLNWWFYLPLKEGTVEARQFCRLDISVQDISEICNRLIEFLSRENVYSGVAVENAEARLTQLQEAKKVDNALPQAWEDLIAGPDGMLVELINEKLKGLCGVEAEPERIKGFLSGLGKWVQEKAESKSKFSAPRQENLSARNPSAAPDISNNVNRRKKPRTTVVGFTFCGQEFSVRSGTEALITLAEEIYRRHGPEFDRVRTLSGWYSDADQHPKQAPVQISGSGWYVYTNISTKNKKAKCRELVSLFKYHEEDLIIRAE